MACADIFASNNSTECNANLINDKKERTTQLSKLFWRTTTEATPLHRHTASEAGATSAVVEKNRKWLRSAASVKDLCGSHSTKTHSYNTAHTARLSNVIIVWTSVVVHEFYKCLVHKSQISLYLMFLGAVLHSGPWLLAIGNTRIDRKSVV